MRVRLSGGWAPLWRCRGGDDCASVRQVARPDPPSLEPVSRVFSKVPSLWIDRMLPSPRTSSMLTMPSRTSALSPSLPRHGQKSPKSRFHVSLSQSLSTRAREYGFALTKSFATDALFFISMVSLPCSSCPLPVVLDAWDVFSYLMPFFSLALPYSRFLPILLFWLLPLPVVAQARVSLVLPMCWASLSTLAISHRQCLTLFGPHPCAVLALRASDQTR